MAANDDVLIVGKLDSKELEKSINDLIDFVGDKTTIMAGKFDSAMDKMKSAMKDFAITQKVSVDLMKEAWKDMSASFDAMFKAQSEASGGGKGSGKGAFDDGTVGQLKELINLEEQRRDKMYLGTEELRKQNELLDEQRAKLRSETTSDPKKLAQQYSSEIKRANLMMDKSLPDAERKLREMLRIKNELRATPVLDADAMAALDKKILVLIGRIRDMRQNARGNTLKDVLGMDESSVDAVARKMRALKSIKVGNAGEIHQLGSEYQRLSRLQAELLGKSIQLTHSNNYLAQSFGYIRNRIVYAMTLGAVTNFVKQMYEVRGQYELLERSLGILIDDMRRGSEIFNELNAMAIKSPFTLMELATGAKQLLAYNFAEEEVVDTTRRLADISAALGVPMERLVYNLGQIRAQTVLTARDARDFANAGLAIVPMLAQMYTEEKRFGNEIVTTAQVFDMMSNKMVSYADVMKIINSVTDEGGKFFDFQAKQAETLRVKMANLTLAWNNMLNEIGAENQSALTLPVNGLKLLFEHWRMIYEIVRDVAIMYGIYRARAILVAAVNGTLITQGVISGMFQLGRAVGFVASAWRILSAAVAANPIGAIATVLATAAVSFGLLNDNVEQAAEYQEKFGKAGAKTVSDLEMYFDTLANISHESSNYKKVMGELNSILGEYDMELVKETDTQEQLNDKRRISIQLIKEEILERKHLNEVEQGRSEYEAKVEDVRKKLREDLSDAITENFLGIGTINEEIAENAPAIANIISDVIENNISAIAGKTGDEYQKGVEKIFAEINSRMKAIGISESTLNKGWLKNSMFRMFEDDIISDAINNIARAKEELDSYTEAIDNAYEAEKKAAEDGANFNDRVEQTQRRLMDAANDTDKFAKKIESLLREYGGENIIDFLVKVKTEVPAWMSQKGLTELTQLSARFTALATQAKKAGKESLNVNGAEFSVEQLFQRAAQYSQAAQNKARDIESRKSATITKEASNALKEYKSALDAVAIAKNRVKQGTADNSLVTEKETEAQAKYNKALKAGVSLEELKNAKKGKNKGSKKDPLGDALTKEIQLITEMQKLYKDYQKAGVDADKARIASSNEYKKSLIAQNNVLKSFGINGLDSSELVKMDARQLRDYYKNLREIASIKGNTKGVEALEKAISNLNVEITKVDYKKITDGLNSELGKIKDDYELAVELDANAELGDLFADMFNIDTSSLPHTFEQALAMIQSSVDNALSKLGIERSFDILKGDINAFAKSVKQSMDGDAIKELEKAQNYIRGIWKKNTEDTIKDWNSLLEKYGDYQTKLIKAAQDTAQEQLNIVRKFGNDSEQAEALDLSKKITLTTDQDEVARIQKQLYELVNKVVKGKDVGIKLAASVEQGDIKTKAKIEWDNFKDSDYYTMMFEDMDRVSTRAIRSILAQLDLLKEKVKDDPASMKALMDAYKKGRDELESRAPFENIIESIKEWHQASVEAAGANRELADANRELESAQAELNNAQSAANNPNARFGNEAEKTERLAKAQERYTKAVKNKNQAEQNVAQAEIKQINAQTKFQNALNGSATALQNVGNLLTQFAELLGIAEDSEAGEMVKSLAQGFTMMATALSLVATVAAIAEMSLGWVAAVAAALTVVISLVSFLAGQSNRKITAQIEEIERDVHDLEIAYKNLEQAADEAYGAMTSGAKAALLANKQAQLEDLERQLELAKSRTGKHYDQDEVDNYQSEIVDLRNEIRDLTNEITNDLLDISSAGDGITDLVDAMIEAFKNGEDAMAAFGDKWDEMIDNMILKMLISTFMQKAWDNVMKTLEEKEDEFLQRASADRAEAQKNYDKAFDMSDDEIAKMIAEQLGYHDEMSMKKNDLEDLVKRGSLGVGGIGMTSYNRTPYFFVKAWQQVTDEEIAAYRKMLKDAVDSSMSATDQASVDFTKWALDYMNGEGRDYMTNYAEMLKAALGDWYSYGQDAQAGLSALQQGIQGISEDTAGALEAYMNSISQQVYLHSELLTQLRDALVNFDIDVQVATMSQMLLQLQQSYQVQLAIQNILNGWSNPSGMAVRVEMV